jgi:hypothetical protein
MVAKSTAQTFWTTASLVAQARACAYHQVALRDLAFQLPAQDEALDRALEEAVQQRDELAFTHLLLAALSGERNVDARHLREGAALFPDLDTLGVAATHCSGDVSEALLGAARSGRLGWEREAAALLLTAWWCQANRDGEMPPSLLGQARTLARKTLFEAEVQFLLLALSDILQDEGFASLLSEVDLPWSRAVVDHLVEGLIKRSQEQVLAHVPQQAEPSRLTGYTVRRSVPRIGRNAPCPCGSGKKYKRCCYDQDRDKLRHSSDVAGVTLEEMRVDPETHLDPRRLLEMRSYELARLDPSRVAPELHGLLVERLALFGEHDAVVAFFETVGYRQELDDDLIAAVNWAADMGDETTVCRLLEIRGEQGRQELDPSLGAQLLMWGREPDPVLKRLEEETRTLLAADNQSGLIDLAHGLLSSRFPALGILVARGALPLTSFLDAGILLERLLMARDRLDLSPQDPIETVVDALHFDILDPREAESEALAEVQRSLSTKEAEVEHLKCQVAALQDTLERESNPPAAGPQPLVADTADQKPAADASPPDLRAQLAALKAELKQRHLERNQIRRDLLNAREELEVLRRQRIDSEGAGSRQEQAEDALLLPEEEYGTQPVRLPVFQSGFSERLSRLPDGVSRVALRLIGSLAAGEVSAFRGAQRLKINRGVWRQKVGSSYRLLFRLGDESLEVVALIHRQDFERFIKSLA